jgi:hypothetical protein
MMMRPNLELEEPKGNSLIVFYKGGFVAYNTRGVGNLRSHGMKPLKTRGVRERDADGMLCLSPPSFLLCSVTPSVF